VPLDFPSSPTDGQIYENYYWDSANAVWQTLGRGFEYENAVKFDYLVIGGGGSGGGGAGGGGSGGGGAGGYRCSVTGEFSGGNSAAEDPLLLQPGSYRVTVGAGGIGSTDASINGSNSQFASVIANGGERGGGGTFYPPNIGGSGGGAYGLEPGNSDGIGGKAFPRQGFDGGNSLRSSVSTTDQSGGGGGGAGAVGVAGTSASGGNGGAGIASSITGSSVTRSGGGGGGKRTGGTAGSGGTGGGGAGGLDANGTNGTPNTGGGGGGAGRNGASLRTGGNGGSGVVIIKYPDTITLSIGGGLTSSTTTSGGFKVTTFTAGSDTVSF
jgi:hypothetical protein